mmetsp:Transcript_31452/g.92232  ORF Transcript_31452/g.92232 Transcript_31452/m.92232 type:complete len:205 (-) Transcript_31452:1556-2170(-)
MFSRNSKYSLMRPEAAPPAATRRSDVTVSVLVTPSKRGSARTRDLAIARRRPALYLSSSAETETTESTMEFRICSAMGLRVCSACEGRPPDDVRIMLMKARSTTARWSKQFSMTSAGRPIRGLEAPQRDWMSINASFRRSWVELLFPPPPAAPNRPLTITSSMITLITSSPEPLPTGRVLQSVLLCDKSDALLLLPFFLLLPPD